MNKSDIVKPAKLGNKGSSASSSKDRPKRPNTEMSPNSSVEEMNVLSHQLEGLSEEVKLVRDDLKMVMKKEDMETFIRTTIANIVKDLTDNMDVTISMKVKEETKAINQKLTDCEKENSCLKKELVSIKTQLKTQVPKWTK